MQAEAQIKIHNATVHASAGSGKTYLLVSRIIQLLLNGAEAGTILAITFTRKAAAEMQQRLLQRLFELAAADDMQLNEQLVQLGARPSAASRELARHLYEHLLMTEHPVTTTTFHAFCQDLLRRFPLEADVPAGFELLEHTGSLQDGAWEALMAEAASDTNTALAHALDLLFKQLGLNNSRQALMSFLQQRSDWWAWTEHEAEPLVFACQRLAEQLNVQPGQDPLQAYFADQQNITHGQQYLAYVLKRDNKTNQKLAAQLENGLDDRIDTVRRYQIIRDCFLTQKGEVRKLKPSKEMQKVYGEQGSDDFIALHASCAQTILDTDEQLAAQRSWDITTAWYLAGDHFLQHYQRIKLEQRLLDFTDLEWKAYQLLNQSENASWVQYKLDNRISHLLIDEFQDTNPTQWQLILPLLEEFASKQQQDSNSVFLVGDAKQSIYRFRRAEPRLFKTASDWLQEHMQSNKLPLNKSWRSSPAIMDFVNRLFGSGPLHDQLTDFAPHETEHKTLWGQVHLLPLVKVEEQQDEIQTELRNPLSTPRITDNHEDPLNEGRLVANTIKQLIAQQTPVGNEKDARAIRYSDILILLRSRTHVAEFEQALRSEAIPYLGAERGTLLEAVEVIDMVKLLRWLLSPYDNHALASILRSPLFAASNEELFMLASKGKGPWQERLGLLVEDLPAESPLRRAHDLLSRWRQMAGQIPVHDLLDRIYSEANVLARYRAAFPDILKSRVTSNLIRFLELALEIDSGRYPSLTRFIKWLEDLRQKSTEAPNEPPSQGQQDRVRLLTIHEAKGLEAAVVFLVDSARSLQRNTANEALVDWSDSQNRPETFLLTAKKDQLDPYSRLKQERLFTLEDREETNLLYVAVTRAKQILYISGSEAARKAHHSWYQAICQQYDIDIEKNITQQTLQAAGTIPALAKTHEIDQTPVNKIDPRLRSVIPISHPFKEIAPSRTVKTHDTGNTLDEDGRLRGLVIHALLEKMTQDKNPNLSRLAKQFGLEEHSTNFQSCLTEAQHLLQLPQLQMLFDPHQYLKAYNEVPISYALDGEMVYGIIDRMLVCDDQILIIDYKTHRLEIDSLEELLEIYKPQLSHYAAGIKKVWPEYAIKPYLLFTHSATLLPVIL